MKWSTRVFVFGLVLTMMLVLLPNISITRDNDVSTDPTTNLIKVAKASSPDGTVVEVYTDYNFLPGNYVEKTTFSNGAVQFRDLGPALRIQSNGGTIRFPKNSTVNGDKIVLDDGRVYLQATIHNSPSAGSIEGNGVMNPFPEEVQGKLETDLNRDYRETDKGGTLSFRQGDRVLGFRIMLADGRIREDARGVYLPFAPQDGLVTDGTINIPREFVNTDSVFTWTP